MPQRTDVDPFADEPAPELAPVRPGEDLDWSRIATYLRANLPADAFDPTGDFEVMQFPNGSANLTYLIRFGDSELVLRRPPFGTLAPGAHDMKREFRVLSRLWRVFDAAPRAYLFCDDHDIGGADFFVMERRRGEVVRDVIPPPMRHHRNVGWRIGMALVDRIAEFHTVDPESADLGALGRPDGFVARQLKGWKQRWDLVADERYDGDMADIHAHLEDTRPLPQRVSLVHNDLKLDNCLFDPANPDRVTAFFDWDMTTLGDPLIELGTLLSYWQQPGDDFDRSPTIDLDMRGFPSRQSLVRRYAESGANVESIDWYEAFGLWKQAVVLQQLYRRFAVGETTDERFRSFPEKIPGMLTGVVSMMNAKRIQGTHRTYH